MPVAARCAELEAYYARLYGLTRDELRYASRLSASIRKKSMGRPFDMPCRAVRAGFPGETLRVLKEKEVKRFGDASQQAKVDALRELPSSPSEWDAVHFG